MENLQEKDTKEIIHLYSMSIKELKRRKVIRTNNVVGELGEYLAIEIYNNTPGLPNLAPAPVGTENIDAISRKGDRYSIKSTSNATTGVFYGLEEPNQTCLTVRSLNMLLYASLMKTMNCRRFWKWIGTHS